MHLLQPAQGRAMPLLVIGNKNYSSWSLRPWLLLRHFGVAFDEFASDLDTPDFFAQIVAGRPRARYRRCTTMDWSVPDSLAICEYANERWLDGRWLARGPARARQGPRRGSGNAFGLPRAAHADCR
jgi:glutathione S-transferase